MNAFDLAVDKVMDAESDDGLILDESNNDDDDDDQDPALVVA